MIVKHQLVQLLLKDVKEERGGGGGQGVKPGEKTECT